MMIKRNDVQNEFGTVLGASEFPSKWWLLLLVTNN